MFVTRVLYLLIGSFFLGSVYADPPFEVLRSCIDIKPKNSSITLTEILGGHPTKMMGANCEDQYTKEFHGHFYGIVSCDNDFYLIINDQKIRADSAINRSINPEIKPGFAFTSHAMWHKITQGNQSYLCIQSGITGAGIGAGDSQYYIIENAFEKNAVPVVYYYFFDKNIIPITSEHF